MNKFEIKSEPQENKLNLLKLEELEPEQDTETAKQTIDLLDQQILINIFEYLDFIDFVNVANATKQFRNAARIIYIEKYANKEVKFNGDVVNKKGLVINESENTIEINDTRMCLKIFRAFGSNLQELVLNFNGIGPRRSQAISKMLNFCCARTLTKLEWNECPVDAMDASSKKFSKLQHLRMTNGSLGVSMSQFNDIFPALRYLELNHVVVVNRKCIEHTFPNLIHLKVHINISRKKIDFTASNIKAALTLNPQIRSFSIGSNCEPKLITFINGMLPLLEKLEIQNPRNKFFDSDEDVTTFKCVKYFLLDIIGCNDTFTNIPFKFKRLEQFTLNASRYCDKWLDFIAQNRKISELKLLNCNNYFNLMNEMHLMKIAGLPKLNHFVLDWRIDSSNSLIRFLEKCQCLQSMRLLLRTQTERALLCSKFGRSWDFDIDKHSVMLQRKGH